MSTSRTPAPGVPPRPPHPAGPVPVPRSDLAEAVRMLVRTVLPAGVLLALVLGLYGGTGRDITQVLQDRFPEDSEWSGLLTITFSSALMVCAGVALGALVVSRAWSRSVGEGSTPSPALDAGLAVAVLAIFLGFDDVMMVHDAVLPGSGIPEPVALAAFGLVGLGLVAWAFRPMRAENLGLSFLVALALLGASLGGDVLESLVAESSPALSTAIGHAEDVVKFLGYAALCHLCVLLARRVMARTLQAATERAAREAVERSGRPGVAAGRVPMRIVGTSGGRHATPSSTEHTTPIPRL